MKIRPFTDADWPAFCRFADKYFGISHNTDRAFNEHWFKASRSDEWTVMVLDGPDGHMAGIMMVIVVAGWFAGRETRLAWISTGVVEEEARTTGAGAGLFLWVYRTFPLVGAFSGNEFSLPMNDLMGQDIPGVAMRRFIYVHDRRTAALCLAEDRKPVLDARFAPRQPTRGALSARWVDAFPQGYGALWGRFRDKVVCTTARTEDHLRWRYLDAPNVTYHLLEMRAGNDLRAVAVARFQDTPEGLACRIVDFVADGDWASDAWQAVTSAAAKAGALFSDFFVVGNCQDAALGDAGFLPADDSTGLAAIPHLLSPVEHRRWTNTFHMGGRLAKGNPSWRTPDAIYFTKADSDRDWPTSYDIKGAGSATAAFQPPSP